MCAHSPYFVKYSRTPEAASLTPTQLKRMANAPASFANKPDDVAEACQFLATLLGLQGTEGISAADKKALITKLKTWQRKFRGKFAGETSERCLSFLQGDRQDSISGVTSGHAWLTLHPPLFFFALLRMMVMMVKEVAVMISKPLNSCNMRGCNRRNAPKGEPLIPCNRWVNVSVAYISDFLSSLCTCSTGARPTSTYVPFFLIVNLVAFSHFCPQCTQEHMDGDSEAHRAKCFETAF
jgi:hypothetical protein